LKGVKTIMATPKGLSRCKDILLEERKVIEEEVLKFGEEISIVQRGDHGKDEDGQYRQNLQNKVALKNQAFAKLRKVNVRIEEIDKGIFTGVCPGCGEKRSNKDICEHPLRELCINCQRIKNNDRR